jgi:hypothetical protein
LPLFVIVRIKNINLYGSMQRVAGFSRRVKKTRMSEMRLPSDVTIRSLPLPEAPARISFPRRNTGQTSPEENLRVRKNVKNKYTNLSIPGSVNRCLGDDNFITPKPKPKPKVTLWSVAL